MTVRRAWDDLPGAARQEVERTIGTVVKAVSTPGGRNSELSETLWTDSGPVFCKGISTESPISYMHRNEIAVSPYLPADLAPRLRWHFEVGGWLLLGFEHLLGRHADLTPDSSDLPLVADAVTRIGVATVPRTATGEPRRISDQWSRALKREREFPTAPSTDPWTVEHASLLTELADLAPSFMEGSVLIHSDLNPTNFVVSDRAKVVDWAWWQTGAAWFDPAYLVIRLIAEGHDPQSAEKWAQQFEAFTAAPPEAITAFAASAVRLWERRFAHTAATEAARRWAQYRTS
ncbi:phosphotransferase [Umezawaea sp. NPDC059074]|uniref:phosphotransferase n=1 Tax=Umezawaea sp. NPDC059074 TaxID=3346716 RepID=UPI00367D736A